MHAQEMDTSESQEDALKRTTEALRQRFDGRLRVIARQSIRYWFNQDRLDRLLAQYVNTLEDCELIYAIDRNGRQVSSNIFPGRIDTSAFGQDLSDRPCAINVSDMREIARRGAFACDAYVSKATRRPCVTVIYAVTSDASLMGFIAADIRPDPELEGVPTSRST